MNQNLTEIYILLDASGSMNSIWKDATGSINTFIEDQKKLPGIAKLTLVSFNSKNISEIFDNENISNIDEINFKSPQGGTPLLDALGKTIAKAQTRYINTPEDERPALVIFYIVTDGEENDSKTLTRVDIKNLIETTQSTYDWKFIYACTDFNSFQEATTYGIASSNNSYHITKEYLTHDPGTWVSCNTNDFSQYTTTLRNYSISGKSTTNVNYNDVIKELKKDKEKDDEGKASI